MKRKRARIIFNPAAGQYPVEGFIRSVILTFKEYGWRVESARSQSGDHVTELARAAAQRGDDAVFVVGGDGTINKAVRGLVGSQTALGILPAGTANVFAQDLHLPPFSFTRWWRLTHNAIILAQSEAFSVDVGWCNDEPFLLWGGIGLDALSVHRLEPRPRYQKYFSVPIYAYTALSTLLFWEDLPLEIEADGRLVRGDYLLAVFNNIHRYMGGMTVLSKNTFMNDGVMDLWLFAGNNMQDAVRHALNMLLGRHVSASKVNRLTVRSAVIRSPKKMPMQVDGEPAGWANHCQFSVQPGALRLLVPPAALNLIQKREFISK